LKFAENSSSDAVIVVTIGNRVIAFLNLHVIPYFTTGDLVGRVSAFAVEVSARNQGIGRQMMAAAEGQARKMGCKAIEVTSADYRDGAHVFYKRLGYPKTSVKFFKELT
jgi:GNAT superfamily N-acetyltransferase